MTGMWRRLRGSGDGGATSIEFVLLTPVLFTLIFGAVQFTLYFHARHVAIAAAQAGARVARASADKHPDTWQGDAVQKSRDYAASLGGDLLRLQDGTPRTVNDGDSVGVQIHAFAPSVIPMVDIPINVESVGPIERFEEDTQCAPGC
jgi:Flp pilus assembly protein TadG